MSVNCIEIVLYHCTAITSVCTVLDQRTSVRVVVVGKILPIELLSMDNGDTVPTKDMVMIMMMVGILRVRMMILITMVIYLAILQVMLQCFK